MASSSRDSWEKNLKDLIRTNIAAGWRVNGEDSGKTKILYVYNEGLGMSNRRTSQTLPIEWKKNNSGDIFKAVEFIQKLVVKKDIPFKEAARRYKAQFIGEDTKAPNKAWEDFLIIPPKFSYNKKEYEKANKEYKAKLKATTVDQFMATKQGLTSKTEKDWHRRIRTFLEIINKRKGPKTGEELVKTCTQELGDIDADARKRYVDGWCEILNYGIERHSMNEKRWQPPNEKYKKELIGKSNRTSAEKLTPYIEEQDLLRLLDDLESSDPEMFLATGLIAIFGLRLSELAKLNVIENKLYVGQIKNNLNTTNKKKTMRRTFAIDLIEKPNLGNKLIKLYDSELIKLPATILRQINLVEKKNKFGDVGAAFRTKLLKNKVWKEIEMANPDVTPYSLRHRFANQAHKGATVPISIKDCASAMGHSSETHMSFYGSYTTELSVERAFELHNNNRIEV